MWLLRAQTTMPAWGTHAKGVFWLCLTGYVIMTQANHVIVIP